MKTKLSILGFLFCASVTFGASLNVWTQTLDSSVFPADAGDASTVKFIESGLSVTNAVGKDFLVLCSFTTGNNGTDNNRQGRWQLATDYTGSDYTYTTASSSVNGSAIYERWINGKEISGVNEYGSANMSGIYNFGSDTNHTFKLYHRTHYGADIRTQNGTLVVVGLNVAGTTLRHGSATQDTTITATGPTPYTSVTTSTNWSAVEKSSGSDLGATVDVSESGGEVFVAASMNCSATGTDGLTIYGEWQLVLYDSATNVVERLGTTIHRQVLNKTQEKGAAMLYAVTSDLTNGTYTVKMEQKVDATSAAAGRGVETFNASINAVGLTIQDGSDAGDRFESFSVGDETTLTNATRVYDRAVEEESILLRVDQGLVLAAHFTTSGDTDQTGDVIASIYEEEGSVALYDSEETFRTVGGSGSKGAGGVIGYTELTDGLYDAALNFRSDTNIYYLPSANLVGFGTEAVPASSLLKVEFEKDGLYGISVPKIASGMGESLETVHAWMESGLLSFRSEGVPIRYHVDEARNRVVLYATAAENWYTRDSVIMISHDKGTQMARRDPAVIGGVEEWIFDVTLRFEEDQYPFIGAQLRPEDFYYWDFVQSGDPTNGQRSYSLDLSGFDGGDVTVKIRLMGWTHTDARSEHLAEFSLNGTDQGSITFDDQEAVEAVLTIPEADVISGINTLTVEGVLQRGVVSSSFVVDGIDVTFERELLPEAPFALFQGGYAGEVLADTFTEPLVVALTSNEPPMWIADENGELPSLSWGIWTTEEWFAVIEAESLPMLVPEPVADDVWFLSETNRIDYLVVTSRELAPAAQELADYRATQGLRVGVVLFEDLCDWFMDGLRTPEAITEMLYYADTYWAEAPWMMVLAGNGHFDYLGALGDEVNQLPPLLVQTPEGLFSSDGELSDLDGDTILDVATGRLPARTPAELTIMISKIKAYETDFGSAWQSEVVLAADVAGVDTDFSAANDLLASLVDTNHTVAARIDLDTQTIVEARADLLERFEAGTGIFQYTGHSSVDQLSPQGLLTAADMNAMTNSRQPIVLALCCLAGRFEVPGMDSVGELMMRRSDGGAVAVWAASGLPTLSPSMDLAEAFYENVFENGEGTLGKATWDARRSLIGDIFTQGAFTVYNLLGDPALRMAGNTAEMNEPEALFSEWRLQTISPEDLADPEGLTLEEEFFDYSMGSDSLVVAELPEFGFPLPLVERKMTGEEEGFILRWRRRVHHDDVEYRVLTSGELEEWVTDSPDLEEVGVEPDPDGIMETVRTWVKSPPGGSQIYVGIQAVRK